MGAVDNITPSGYTQEDLRDLIVGSETANRMKKEIKFVFRFLVDSLYKRCERGDLPQDKKGLLIAEKYFFNQPALVVLLTHKRGKPSLCYLQIPAPTSDEIVVADYLCGHYYNDQGAYDLLNPSGLKLEYVKSVYDILPKFMAAVARRFPILAEDIAKVSEFAKYAAATKSS